MDERVVLGILVVLVGASLVGAPITMADWQEKAVIDTERIDGSSFDEGTPILQYENLTGETRWVVERAISSPDGSVSVYGNADWPDRFVYSRDYVAPGHGEYGLLYDGERYVLRTSTPDSWGIGFWFYVLPFVVYGVVLLWVGLATAQGERSRVFGALAAVPGAGVHLLGPAFDFPVLSPVQFVGGGVVATVALVAAIAVTHYR